VSRIMEVVKDLRVTKENSEMGAFRIQVGRITASLTSPPQTL